MSNQESSAGPLPKIVLYVTGAIVLLTLLFGLLAMFQSGGPNGDADGERGSGAGGNGEDEFIRLSNTGKNFVEQGNALKAVEAFERAVAVEPNDTNALVNLAIAQLMANQAEPAVRHAERALALNPNAAAALYVAGCAELRLGQLTNALRHLQQAKQIDRTVNAVSFQLGRAYQQLGRLEEALEQFQEVVQFDPNHPSAHYNLSQVLLRLGRRDEAQVALRNHQQLNEGESSQITDPFAFERCQYTRVIVPFKLEQPDKEGIPVTFADATAAAFGGEPIPYLGPVGAVDLQHDGRPELWVREGANGFRLLFNSNGVFHPAPDLLASATNGPYHACLVGDMNNDGSEDVIVLGEQGSHLFKITTNGVPTDLSLFSRMKTIAARAGLLADLDFTGKLDLLAWGGASNTVAAYRNLGQPYFIEATTNAGLPLSLTAVRRAAVDDWNGDDLLDLVLAREGRVPELYLKQRGGAFALTNSPAAWPPADTVALADLNNDGRTDLMTGQGSTLTVFLNGSEGFIQWELPGMDARGVRPFDFDNDGWLDLLVFGRGLGMWRNVGRDGFIDVSESLGLAGLSGADVRGATIADFDLDGDSDVLLTLGDDRLRFLRNDGGNAHRQLKIHLIGRKSNASGLGIEVEILAGGLRINRRIASLPVEIGVGDNERIDSLTAHWFDFDVGTSDVPVNPTQPLPFIELQIRDGSCPYLYVWDGRQYRFVTDVLGAAPLGLPVNEERFVDSYPFEYVRLGSPEQVGLKDGRVVVQLTEELREVMYLDEATLAVVDKAPDTEVHSTSKLVPGRPFPETKLVTLHRRHPLRRAQTDSGADVLAELTEIDARFVSPARMRIPQLRGLAETHRVTFEVDPLDPGRPLTLALTGWLRYGGGMANMAASHRTDLPFPFPVLEVWQAEGEWASVDVTVGAPAGHTKTILVDLQNKIPAGSRRFRLSSAFEIHWDRMALFERPENPGTRITWIKPAQTDLHWRGYSEYLDLPWHQPLTPDYGRVRSTPPWRITPSGWATRYGTVDELIAETDDALALVCGGDELTVAFEVGEASPQPAGMEREYFLYLVGWDKDADFHVEQGWRLEPLPWHGMNDQRYGRESRPPLANDDWISRYNTRWVGPRPLAKSKK